MFLDNWVGLLLIELGVYHGPSLHFLLIKTDRSIQFFYLQRSVYISSAVFVDAHISCTLLKLLMKNFVPRRYLRGVNRPTRLHFKYFQDFSICIYIETPGDKNPGLVLLQKENHWQPRASAHIWYIIASNDTFLCNDTEFPSRSKIKKVNI